MEPSEPKVVPKGVDCEVKPLSNASLSSNSETPPRVIRVAGDSKASFWKRDKDQFNGKRALSRGYLYRRPDRHYLQQTFHNGHKLEEIGLDNQLEYRHRDYYGRITYKKKDVLRYISPTECDAKHLIVQATPDVCKNQPAGDWRRVKIGGKVPIVLRLSEWALAPSNRGITHQRHFLGVLNMCLRVVLVTPALLILLSLPIEKAWVDSDFQESYTDFPNYFWDYPKYARNSLDMEPAPEYRPVKPNDRQELQNLSSKVRLLRPRQLVVLRDSQWVLDSNPSRRLPYIFISYTNEHFHTDTSEDGRQSIEQIAQAKAQEAGLQAYWLDFRCRAPTSDPDLLTADVHRLCDVIRGARGICVILPDLSLASKRVWGSRMWTLPEALLSSRQDIKFCSLEKTETLSKLDMTDEVWDDGDPDDGDNQPTRLLAEHYSSVLTLGRLELFSVALEALAHRFQRRALTDADLAYALMGLLHYRIQMRESESLFQGLARLSLANDSDRLVERMVCMFPKHNQQQENLFLALVERDQFQTHLWDVQPLCQVAGVGEDREVILDGCRGVSIRWKAFPQMKYKRSAGFRKFLAEIILRSGAYWSALGLALMIRYTVKYDNERADDSSNQDQDIVLVFLGALAIVFAFILSLAAPKSVRLLYGGRVTQSAPWLIGFEGVMPIDKLERIIFGNVDGPMIVRSNDKSADMSSRITDEVEHGRLTYEPSSTPFSERERGERIGKEPRWVRDSENPASVNDRPLLPKGHRFFTLVDTGSLTVSIFSAVRPPSVALICGREGGMLRT
ncbi:MAG: hypothetical protein M1830_004712, partial [Pleopsidium flavum]